MSDEINCIPLGIGESKVVRQDSDESPTGVPTSYILRRVSKKRYVVEFNPRFVDSWLAMIFSYPSNETEPGRKMRERVQACLQEANGRFFGPDGESFEMHLAPKDSPLPEHRASAHYIEVVCNNPKHRHNSKRFGQDIDCGEIVHELLHATGLVDEYVDKNSSGQNIYDCRTAVQGSIMGDETTGTYLEINSVPLEVRGCVCREDNPGCDLSSVGKECPSGSEPFIDENFRLPRGQDFDPKNYHYSKPQKNLKLGILPPSLPIVVRSYGLRQPPEPAKSLLRPAHFRAIVYPSCQAKNARYYKCAKSAYQSSLEIFGFKVWRCADAPPECQDGSWLE